MFLSKSETSTENVDDIWIRISICTFKSVIVVMKPRQTFAYI